MIEEGDSYIGYTCTKAREASAFPISFRSMDRAMERMESHYCLSKASCDFAHFRFEQRLDTRLSVLSLCPYDDFSTVILRYGCDSDSSGVAGEGTCEVVNK